MLTVEEILVKLGELRKEYQDDEEDPTYQALHHAYLFISYKITDFKAYVAEAKRLEEET
jgi:hypothetical protein